MANQEVSELTGEARDAIYHIMRLLCKASDNHVEILRIIDESENNTAAEKALQERFDFPPEDAHYVLGMYDDLKWIDEADEDDKCD